MNPSFTDRFCSLRLFLLVSLLSLSTYTYSQTLSGRIADEDTREALGFASVTVLSLPDSSEVGGTLTDIDGVFTLSLEPGTYLLAMRFLGYQPVVKGPIELKKGQITDFGLIGLFQRQVSIDEVEITSQVTQMELDLDKRVYRVDQDLSLAGSSASEILQNLPSVQVDPEGAVSLRGSQNVRILINGRPSGLTEGLQLMQGNMIEKIEVITNPSARYDAEGEAGIINIILKKEKEKGFNGAFTLGTGWPQNHNLGANVNYRSGKINWFANIGSNYRSGPGGGGYYQEEYENGETSLITEQDNQRIRSSLGGNFRTGADLIFNDYNTLTVSGLLSYDDEENLTNIVYRDFTSEKVLSQTTTRDQVEAESDKNVEFQSTYRKTFPQKDREWVSTVQYQLNDDLELGDITQQTNGGEILYQRSSNTEDEANWLIQSDYIHPFGKEDKFRLETGTRITLRSIENDYLVEEQNIGGAWAALPDFDNRFNYEENIYAGYGIFSQKLDKFGYQLGLRAEYTDLSASLLNASADIQKNYLNWFPSAFFSYKVNQENTLQLSYSRRLSRPGFRSLLPFSSFSDARNLRIGNPDLDPEYTHSFELGYLAYWESGSLLSSVYYRHRTGVIERITTIAEDGVTFRIPVNLSVQQAVGIELSGSQDITDWWTLSGNLNFYGSETEGSYDTTLFYAQTLALNTRINSRMTLPADIRLQVSGSYNAPQVTPQGRQLARYDMDLGLAKQVMKDKGTLTLSVRDVFNSNRWRDITNTDDFYRESNFQWRVRQISLSFTYRLNQDNQEKGRKEGRGGQGEGFDGGDM